MEKIYIFCDGGCRGNQFDENIGGFGAVLQYNDHVEELSGTRHNTTNNIMELTSCIMALRYLPKRPLSVEIIMDSSYVISGINEWVSTWLDNGWVTAKKKPVENRILWEELLKLIFLIKDIKFILITMETIGQIILPAKLWTNLIAVITRPLMKLINEGRA